MTKKIKILIFGVFLIIFAGQFIGCASVPTREKMAMDISGYNPPQQVEQETGLIYVVRPSIVGTLIRFNVFLDNEEKDSEMGYTRGSQYIYFYITPGQHTIKSKAENWAEVPIDIKSGETIFLKQNVQMGIIMARNSLEKIDEVEGKYQVKNSKLGTIIKTRR